MTAKPDLIPGIASGVVMIGTTFEIGDYATTEFNAVVSHPMPRDTLGLRAEMAELEARAGRFARQSAVRHEKKS